MLNVNIHLENQKLVTVPSFQEIFSLLFSIFPTALDHFKLILRLSEVFGFTQKEILKFNQVIERDSDYQSYKESIVKGMI